jgi:hypothetical protein
MDLLKGFLGLPEVREFRFENQWPRHLLLISSSLVCSSQQILQISLGIPIVGFQNALLFSVVASTVSFRMIQ